MASPGGTTSNCHSPRHVRHLHCAFGADVYVRYNPRDQAVVSLHKDTFQPHTGVRTCALQLDKPLNASELDEDYPIFMAISRKIGQDSEGVPVFKMDDQGRETSELDHDLGEILVSYQNHIGGNLTQSEFTFTVSKSGLEPDTLNINPQDYLPAYNESISSAIRIGEQDGWTSRTIGSFDPNVF